MSHPQTNNEHPEHPHSNEERYGKFSATLRSAGELALEIVQLPYQRARLALQDKQYKKEQLANKNVITPLYDATVSRLCSDLATNGFLESDLPSSAFTSHRYTGIFTSETQSFEGALWYFHDNTTEYWEATISDQTRNQIKIHRDTDKEGLRTWFHPPLTHDQKVALLNDFLSSSFDAPSTEALYEHYANGKGKLSWAKDTKPDLSSFITALKESS